jgi:SAM-dependent methyltransferase
MSAHHFTELEHIFSQVKRALKPAGLFFLYEFVGPSQFQWTDQQLAIINDLLQILPAKYRQYIPFSGQLKEQSRRMSVAEMNTYDPSEAIRSAEIIPLLPQYFNIVERIDYGGTILHMLVQDIVGNFDTEKEEDLAILKLLCYLEETLIRSEVLPSDFTFIVAQNVAQNQEQKHGPVTHLAKAQKRHTAYLAQRSEEFIHHLSAEDIAQFIPIRKLIKAVGFKIGNRLGFR